MEFKFKKDTDIPKMNKTSKKRHLGLKFTIVLAVLIWSSLAVYGIVEFYNTHNFRTPVIFQNPIPLKELESPIGSRSGMIKQAYAEEKNPYELKSPKGIAWELVKNKWGTDQWDSFDTLIQKESGWNPYSVNSSSGACGLGQALPCSKLPCEMWDYDCQINWIISYIEDRYTNPIQAINFHLIHNYY